jgi:hypothetical protein
VKKTQDIAEILQKHFSDANRLFQLTAHVLMVIPDKHFPQEPTHALWNFVELRARSAHRGGVYKIIGAGRRARGGFKKEWDLKDRKQRLLRLLMYTHGRTSDVPGFR